MRIFDTAWDRPVSVLQIGGEALSVLNNMLLFQDSGTRAFATAREPSSIPTETGTRACGIMDERADLEHTFHILDLAG